MLTLLFDGWFQCRLPTNPDPADEPRGVSGYTFALANELDLDRIIRFNDPVDPRSHAPQVGVAVRSVLVDGVALPFNHPLVGARVDLLGKPVFDAANGILIEEAYEPIMPFDLQVSLPGQGELLRAKLPDFDTYKQDQAKRRLQVVKFFECHLFAAQAGVQDPLAWRRRRLEQLRVDLAKSGNAVEQCALRKRIQELEVTEPRKNGASQFTERRLLFLNVVEIRRVELDGQKGSRVPALLGREPDMNQRWVAELWMGAWDADALSGFVKGAILIPLRPESSSRSVLRSTRGGTRRATRQP
ncbi:hypothetical protein [Pyxidicoccus trucidator]|uniref:hypothetical protein n=1 Tax=Pyxidicoccus trucidator TaxID=2709662 RepID=UPI0013DC1887|nr:hypothetical protein [Pyxidicoccus trucidator]